MKVLPENEKTLDSLLYEDSFFKQRRSRQGPKSHLLANGEISNAEQENMQYSLSTSRQTETAGNTCRD